MPKICGVHGRIWLETLPRSKFERVETCVCVSLTLLAHRGAEHLGRMPRCHALLHFDSCTFSSVRFAEWTFCFNTLQASALKVPRLCNQLLAFGHLSCF